MMIFRWVLLLFGVIGVPYSLFSMLVNEITFSLLFLFSASFLSFFFGLMAQSSISSGYTDPSSTVVSGTESSSSSSDSGGGWFSGVCDFVGDIGGGGDFGGGGDSGGGSCD